MSTFPVLPGDPTPSPGDTQATLEALGPWSSLLAGAAVVLGLASVPPKPEPPPDDPLLLLDRLSTQTRRELYDHLVKNGTPPYFASVLAYIYDAAIFVAGLVPAVFFFLMEVFGPSAVKVGLGMVDQFRKKIDVDVANTAVLVLNELLGTEFVAEHFPTGEDVDAHIARAQQIGGLFHHQMMQNLENLDPTNASTGNVGAERFTGQLVNFGVATALLGLAGELGTAGFIKNFRLIGEQVSSGLGLSRLHRMAMRPLMQTMIAQPYSWYLNQKFHPTQFKEGDLINPFNQELMSHDLIFKSMDLLGYSQDKIEELIKLHSKKVPLADLELFDRYGIVPRDQTLNLMRVLGYPDDISEIILRGVDLHRADAALAKLVDTAETSVVDGHITIDDFSALLDSLPLGHHEKVFRLQALQYKSKAPHTHLTVAQAQKAFEDGIWDLTQLEEYFARRGYSADDVNTLELLTLLAFAKLEEAKKVAQFAYDKKVAAAKAKHLPVPPPPAILAGG
jgi:hypothetical protein